MKSLASLRAQTTQAFQSKVIRRRASRRSAARPRPTRGTQHILHFDIKPGIGVGPVRLGMTRAEVHSVLGTPEWKHGEREMFLSGFMVDYDSTGCVEFIELANSPRFIALFEGVCLHHVPATAAVALVSRFDTFDPTGRELGYSYIFLNLQMSLWRSMIVSEEEAKDTGDPRGFCFEAVGIAVPGYFVAGK